ncbi:hypothetical protein [Phocaeicola barnesiae]|uniref:Uncharacterized protein n=1 Tax=Phocaeicola barnesiae TaxID=376804 RepID=A0AAW5N9H0_9BACT|nr:hypothetical protein [Phocaeicola barnesiae]MCR8874898.1 hypothetical protein [Phocaeicola barnesiae]
MGDVKKIEEQLQNNLGSNNAQIVHPIQLPESYNVLSDTEKSILINKLEKLSSYANADERINKLLSKDVKEIKRIISVEKSKLKKKENENADYSEEIDNVIGLFKDADVTSLNTLISKLEKIREKNKEKYIKSIDNNIEEYKKKIEELEALKEQFN